MNDSTTAFELAMLEHRLRGHAAERDGDLAFWVREHRRAQRAARRRARVARRSAKGSII